MNSKMKLVLHCREEGLRRIRVSVVVHGSGIDIGDLLVKPPFAGPNLPDLSQQVVKVLLTEETTVFQPFFVQHIATYGEITQDTSCPLPELGGSHGVDAVANGDDGIQTVVLRAVVLAVRGSYSEIPNN